MIGTLVDITRGKGLLTDGDWIESKDQDTNGDVALIQLADIKDGYFKRKSSRRLTSEKAEKLNCTFLKKGDVLIARMPDPLGRCCIYIADERKAVTVVDVCIARTNPEKYSNKWLMHSINSPQFRSEINKLQSGTTRKRISKKNLALIQFSILPKKEQDLTVETIEIQFTRLDAAIKSLNIIRQKLCIYRNSVLKIAFTGNLSKEYRKLNQNKAINKKMLSHIIDDFNNKKEGKDKPGKLPPSRFDELQNLPGEWFWIEAHKVCSSVRDGTHDTPKYVKEGYPLVTSKNLSRNGLNFIKIKYISENDHVEIKKRSGVEKGDILFGMIGTIGNPTIIDDNNEFSVKNVGLFKKNYGLLKPKYIKYWLESGMCMNILKRLKRIKGTTQQFIPLGHLRILPVPYCNIGEQERIVSEIESRFSVINKLEGVINNSLKKAERLRKSILKVAFEDKLVN